ncbi:beta-hexosaminidase (plasmid) [Sinorhizobium fredii NGR234]|uniref:Beta-hexosaminidase n=1 Tax=Sinorhizobium fredii (strain NBRC 101917 / NGR234) TaxID=394 RepID=C3KKW5_SINFN|nr:glycoside hydrolase family 3 N-terminal domain-containing protein [Sinorhizobium fredii]ACP23051.1 beta-hexosaminidase [Sinorhizobium fredii NGR234]
MTIERDARAVFLPAFDSLDFHDVMEPFLRNGGCSILIGESRSEYVARRMSKERLLKESASLFLDTISRLKVVCPRLIVAVDEEMSGIRRLEGLAPPLPDLIEARSLSLVEVEGRCFENAKAARALGVTMYLAPIADIVDGQNPWLAGRTLGIDKEEVGRLVSAYISGVQRAGVIATTKHFPGFNHLDADPALTDVSLHTSREEILENAGPFHAAVRAGTKAIMVGPAPVTAIDPENAACTSEPIISMLRRDFGFDGLIVSDDLDAPATMRQRNLLDTAIASLNAGTDLLLVAGGHHLEELCDGVVEAVMGGDLAADRLAAAANRVRIHTAGSVSG